MKPCDVCDKPITSTNGYHLTTMQVLTSEEYWERTLSKQYANVHQTDPNGNSLAIVVATLAATADYWNICEECSQLFKFDKLVARRYSEKGTSPPGTGPAVGEKTVLAAACGWSKLYHSWPQSVQVGNDINTLDVNAGVKCDFCYRIVTTSSKEMIFFLCWSFKKRKAFVGVEPG